MQVVSWASPVSEREIMEEWFVYQIGGAERNVYHFIITWGMDDSAVESQLREGEFIDCVVTLSGVLKGSVEIIPKAG